MTTTNDQLDGTELDSQSLDGSNVDPKTAEAQSEESTTIEWTHELESEFNDKISKENYDPTIEELESYEQWVTEGKPTPEPKDEKEPEEEPTEETNLEASESEADSSESNDDLSNPSYSDDEITSLTDAMKAVGAKTVNELPEKIKGLRSYLGKQGGEMGTELKTAQEQNANMANLLQGLGRGDASAIEYMKANGFPEYGGLQAKADEAKPEPTTTKFNSEEALDPAMAEYVSGLESQMKQMQTKLEGFQGSYESAQKQSQEQAAQFAAVEQVVNDVSSFVSKHPEYWDAAAPVADMTRTYYRQDPNDPVDPRMTKVHDLLEFANNNGLKNLEDAHFLMNRESFSQQLIDAETRGRESAFKHKATPSASNHRSQKSETTYQQYTEQDVQNMISGKKEIPEEWIMPNGMIDKSKVPAFAHQYI